MTPGKMGSDRATASMRGAKRRTIVMCANTAWNLANFRAPIITSLLEDGYRVIATAAKDGAESRLLALGAEFRPLPIQSSSRNPLDDFRLILALRRLLRAERPAALMTFTIKPNIYGTLAARMTRTHSLATISGLGSAFLAGGRMGRLIDRLYRLALRGAGAVFFQNDEDCDIFLERQLVRAEQVRRVPGSGVDLAAFPASPLPGGPAPVFLFIGRLLLDKGVREFVEAATLVRHTGHESEFRILGECGVENPSAVPFKEVERWAADGTIRYLGPTEDVRPAIAESDCVVLPSYREGVPRSLLEASAMGRPLIATDVPGCRDVVDDGINGFLCEARSAPALADAIRRMMALAPAERQAMGVRGRTKVENEFGVERVVAAYRRELGL